jgi:hypothetical protein
MRRVSKGIKGCQKKCPAPQLIVGPGLITVGLEKGEEESLPPDLNIPHQGSEHVLWTR